MDVIVHISRLRDGSRVVDHVTEVMGMEGDVILLQNLVVYDVSVEASGKLKGQHRSTGVVRPRFLGARGVLWMHLPACRRAWAVGGVKKGWGGGDIAPPPLLFCVRRSEERSAA